MIDPTQSTPEPTQAEIEAAAKADCCPDCDCVPTASYCALIHGKERVRRMLIAARSTRPIVVREEDQKNRLHDALQQLIGWVEECGSNHEGRQYALTEARAALKGFLALSRADKTDADLRAFGASDAACYKYPDDTELDRACRAAYIAGAAESHPVGEETEVVLAAITDIIDKDSARGTVTPEDHRRIGPCIKPAIHAALGSRPTSTAEAGVVGWMATPHNLPHGVFARVFAHTEFRARELGDAAYGPALFDVLPLTVAKSASAAEAAGERTMRDVLIDARMWLAEDDRHFCKAETLTELLNNIDCALATPSPDAARPSAPEGWKFDHDTKVNVVYLTKSNNRPASGIDMDGGIVWRFAEDNDELVGITLLNPPQLLAAAPQPPTEGKS